MTREDRGQATSSLVTSRIRVSRVNSVAAGWSGIIQTTCFPKFTTPGSVNCLGIFLVQHICVVDILYLKQDHDDL
jgi:hypothetical protein